MNSFSSCVVQLQNFFFFFSSHSSDNITVPEIRTTGGTTPIVTYCAIRAEFLRHSMYEAVSLNAIMTHESQCLYRKVTFREGFLLS